MSLSDALLAHVAEPLRSALSSWPHLPDRLTAVLDACRERWSSFTVEPAVFLAHLGARIPPDSTVEDALGRAHVADLYLACACLQRDDRALQELEVVVSSTIAAGLARLRVPDVTVDEVQQELRERLLVGTATKGPEIGDYGGRGPLGGWIRVMAVRRALKTLERARKRPEAGDEALVDLVADPDAPERKLLQSTQRALFVRAFSEALRSLPSKSRNLLRYHLLDGMTPEEIGRIHGAHRITVGRWLEKIRETLYERTRKNLMDHLGANREDAESLMRVVPSQVDLSLDRLLLTQPP